MICRTTSIDQLGKALITLLLAGWADDEIGPTLRAILQTAMHELSTRGKLRRVVEGSLMGVSKLGSDERDRLVRSGLIGSQLMGFALMRHVGRSSPPPQRRTTKWSPRSPPICSTTSMAT
jgi:hypothetical protein